MDGRMDGDAGMNAQTGATPRRSSESWLKMFRFLVFFCAHCSLGSTSAIF
jgi:hypothetical protein